MAEIGRREALLLLIGLDDKGHEAGSVSGITRLQKFLFLLEKEGGVRPKGNGFEFEPYKAGPYSPKLYDDLELLENLGLISSVSTAESTATEDIDIERLSFDDLMGGFSDIEGAARAADSSEERKFALTEEGRKRLEKILAQGTYAPVVDGIRKVKTKYNCYSLRDLLKYVYTKYPEMTTESEIIDDILGRKGR